MDAGRRLNPRSSARLGRGRTTELVFWVFRRRRRWRVSGTSMEPDYRDGDLVLVDPRRGPQASVGDVVVTLHPFKNVDVIKYVAEIHDDGYTSLRSPAGDDSRQFGRVLTASIKGRVTTNLSRTRPRTDE